MPRTALAGVSPNALSAAGGNAVLAGSLAASFIASDNVNGNQFVATGNDVLMVYNSDVGSQTVTILSAPDQYGRKADVGPYTIAAGQFADILITNAALFKQTDGNIYLASSAATVKYLVLNIV